jgi:peptide/nickel transport system permease protein
MSLETIVTKTLTWVRQNRQEKIQAEEAFYRASQWQLVWWRFRKHKLAQIAMVVLAILYFIAAFCEFLSPYGPEQRFAEYSSVPPMAIHLFDRDENGRLRIQPFVYGLKKERDPVTARLKYAPDPNQKFPVRFFVRGPEYKLWGKFKSDLHLFGAEGIPVFLMGTDKIGRDVLTRIFYGSRISLTVGLVGVFFSFVLGLILGGISGYFGGTVDEVIQRIIDLLISIPTIPLWMALAAALPQDWSQIRQYFVITLILSILGWTSLARVVRGKILSLREEDFTLAARLYNASEWRIITRHLLPAFASYIIVSLTLAIPNMILGETALSFLSLGLRPPTISWGVMLQDAQNIISIAQTPWMLWPCAFVIITVLMFNFLGDGLRDAADPYAK